MGPPKTDTKRGEEDHSVRSIAALGQALSLWTISCLCMVEIICYLYLYKDFTTIPCISCSALDYESFNSVEKVLLNPSYGLGNHFLKGYKLGF